MIVKILVAIFQILLLMGSIQVYCMPAYPKKIPVRVEDGIVYIQMYGDEHNKRAENSDGYTIIQKGGIWYFAEKDSVGLLKPSAHLLVRNTTDDTRRFLQTISKHLTNGQTANQSRRNSRPNSSSHAQTVQGVRKVLVILMQYKDLPMVKSQEDFNMLFNQIGYSEDGAQGSVFDFYTDVSYGQLQLVCDVIGPFTSKNNRSYYGSNDRDGDDNHPEELFEEAINQAISEVSLKDYDSDNDGFVDNVHILFAGHGEEAGAPDDAIWSHEATFYQPYEIQGMKIDRYSCAPELRGNSGKGISRIGPHCHEIGHALGAMDYYDTNYDDDGGYDGTGEWDVMASGSWNNDGITPADFNPYVKAYDYGWITPKDLPSGDVTIYPSFDTPEQYYKLGSPYSADYYLLENRSKERWGAGVPGEGLLIFHIHPEIMDSENRINATSPQKCYVVCASSKSRLPNNNPSSYGDIDSAGCPYPGTSNNNDFGQASIPAAFFWDDEECGIEINKIAIDPDGNIHLENNSIGTGGDDVERKRVFFEGFEEDKLQIEIIRDDLTSLAPTWVVESNPQGPSKIITKPSAYKGEKCLQLSAKRVPEYATSQFYFNILKITEEGQTRLKLYVCSLNPNADNPNIIRIAYGMEGSNELQYVEFQSSENNSWKQFVLELPNGILPQILCEGIAFSGSILAIDNLEVEQIKKNAETEIRPTSFRITQDTGDSYYSLDGIKHKKPHKGINIINRDGKIIKIVY